jgi:hypothetical protein
MSYGYTLSHHVGSMTLGSFGDGNCSGMTGGLDIQRQCFGLPQTQKVT